MGSNPTERFSNRVENYVKYRPGYPPVIVDLLAAECHLTSTSVIADVGSGTGLLARLFLQNGNPVWGIEPNQPMRTAAEQFLKDYPNFTSIAAVAEATTLPESSVDFVTAGQSFHWFSAEEAWIEFKRILKPGGWIVLVWNERQLDATPFLGAYEELLQRYAPEYQEVSHQSGGDIEFKAFFGPGLQERSFANSQFFGYEGVKGRLLSSSYAPLAGHPNHEPMLDQLQRIFEAHQVGGQIEFKYITEVYYGQPAA
jgi:SAM-dependent methyltransferase